MDITFLMPTKCWFCCTGFGVCCGFVGVLPLMARNFSAKQQGCITGLLFSFLFVGPATYAAIYGACFINGHNTDPQNQDLPGYFLFSACMAFVVYTLAIIFAEEIPYEPEPKPEKTEEKSEGLFPPEEDTQLITMEIEEMPQPPELTGLALLKTLNFHLVLWPYILSPSVQLTFVNNMSSFLHSFRLGEYTTVVAVLSPAIGSVANLALGTLSDKTLHRIPRVFYQLVFNIIQTVFLLLSIFWLENITLFIFTTIMLSISYSAMMSISPSILMEVSGMQYYGRNVGGMFFGMGVGTFVLQIIVGVLYDRTLHLTPGTDHINCYGRGCFLWSFVLMCVLSGIAVVLQSVFLYRRIMLRRRWRF
jgi:MFS family permease